MTKYAQIVMGSAGTGKSTYCKVLQEHCTASRRTVRVGNLDPAAEVFGYTVDFDLRELISVDDVMEEMGLGPNGGLLYCMEYLVDNLEWLEDHLDEFGEDEYLLLDVPGQVELYTHVPVFKHVADCLRKKNFNVCVVYCLDSTFLTDASKFIAGNLMALSAMVQMELPHVNVLTKCDLAENKEDLERFLSPSGEALACELAAGTPPRYRLLNEAMCKILDEYDMVTFLPLDITDEESIGNILLQVDHAIAYGEELEPKEPWEAAESREASGEEEEQEEEEDDGGGGAGLGWSSSAWLEGGGGGGDGGGGGGGEEEIDYEAQD
jgi:GTPase SAR1 family protein